MCCPEPFVWGWGLMVPNCLTDPGRRPRLHLSSSHPCVGCSTHPAYTYHPPSPKRHHRLCRTLCGMGGGTDARAQGNQRLGCRSGEVLRNRAAPAPLPDPCPSSTPQPWSSRPSSVFFAWVCVGRWPRDLNQPQELS